MITILAHLRLHPGRESEADQAFLEMAAAVEANEPGAWIYTMHRSHEDPLDVYVYEVYEDEEAFELHINTDYIEKLRSRLAELADPSFSSIRVLEPVAGFARPAP
jgi:quinol monooxygenase YgiN